MSDNVSFDQQKDCMDDIDWDNLLDWACAYDEALGQDG